MKQYNRIALANLAAVLATFPLTAKAVVIVDDAVLSRTSATRQVLGLTQSIPIGRGLFAIYIDALNSSSFEFKAVGIAEEYGFYDVPLGAAFGPAFAAANNPIVSNNGIDPLTSLQLFSLNQSKYFGYWDDRLNGNFPDSSDNYGWVQITRTSSGLVAASGATAIGGGIVVGTTNQIPEPSSSLLLALSLGPSLACRLPRQVRAS